MTLSPLHPALLARVLRDVPRRYRVPAHPAPGATGTAPPPAVLASLIEQARVAVTAGRAPSPALAARFVAALAQLIDDAVRGDAAFQAMVQRHSVDRIRVFATLATQQARDVRLVRQAVAAIAHPAKLLRMPAGPCRDALQALHHPALHADWDGLAHAMAPGALPCKLDAPGVQGRLARLQETGALDRLQRLSRLRADPQIQAYMALCARQGPSTGSDAAAAQGRNTRARGDAVEAQTTQALQALADRLNAQTDAAQYRVVSSLRVPSRLSAQITYAKTEWDAVLLWRPRPATDEAPSPWAICLLAEAKASVDAATTDFARLTRGLRLLADATPGLDYVFPVREGDITIGGTSLAALRDQAGMLADTVLYCCDMPAEPAVRPLNAAARMQLLSAPASLDHATQLASGARPDTAGLTPVWTRLTGDPAWRPLLDQYDTLRQVRELMVHIGDLMTAVTQAAPAHGRVAPDSTPPIPLNGTLP